MHDWSCRGLLVAIALLAPLSRGRAQAPRDTATALTRAQVEAQQECKNSINSRPGYQATWVGKPVLRKKQIWEVPLTARRDGEVDERATCRFDPSSGRVTLRPR